MCGCFACIHAHAPGKDIRSTGTRVTDCCKLSFGCSEMYLGLLEEQPVLSMAEPLQPHSSTLDSFFCALFFPFPNNMLLFCALGKSLSLTQSQAQIFVYFCLSLFILHSQLKQYYHPYVCEQRIECSSLFRICLTSLLTATFSCV